MKYKVKHVDWHKAGVVTAAITALFSLVFVVLMVPFAMMGSAFGEGGMGEMGFGVGFLIVIPFIYAFMGYIFGALYAAIYNFVASRNLALEIELEQID